MPWLRPRSIAWFELNMAIEPEVKNAAENAVQSLIALVRKFGLRDMKEMSAGAYKFQVSVKDYSRGDGPYLSFGLLQENGKDVRGDDVVSFLVHPENGKIGIKAQRNWCMDSSALIDVPIGSEHALLLAILRVCAQDMDSIRLSPKRALHTMDVYARTMQKIRDRSSQP